MSQVVYTSIQRIEDLAGATWRDGWNESYAVTQKMAERLPGEILLVGRLDKLGRVHLICAKAGRDGDGRSRPGSYWRNVNASHVALARFFSAKLDAAPVAATLAPFFDEIDEPSALKSARSLVYLDCGTNGSADDFGRSVNAIGQCLSELGISAGDWTFLPMMKAVGA